MKISLVYPAEGPLEHFIPLGIGFIGAYLQKNGIQVQVLDMRYHSYKDLILAAKTSEYIGFSSMTLHFKKAVLLAKVCKKANSKVKIVFGGPHPTIFPKETLIEKVIDYVVIGEGEKTLYDLIQQKQPITQLKGIAYKLKGKIIINPVQDYIENIDDLPFADRDLFPVKSILKKTPYWPCLTPYPQLSMISTRGCPYNCVYCQPTLRKIFGQITRRRSPERTVDEMEYLYRKYEPASIFMADDLFTADQDWTMKVCAEIRQRGLHKKLLWECESRANTFNAEIAQELKKSGCYMVWFGTESYCQNTLNTLRKGTTVEQNIKALRICQKYGLMSLEQLMVGNPKETIEDLQSTLKYSRETQADISAVAVTSPVPGTDLYDLLLKNNLILTENLDILGNRFKGKEKFKLDYSTKFRDDAYDRLKAEGEIKLKFLIRRSYYRQIFIKRLISHINTQNYKAFLVDIGRLIYGSLPYFLINSLTSIVNPIKGYILKQK